jgi:hypothetical protein
VSSGAVTALRAPEARTRAVVEIATRLLLPGKNVLAVQGVNAAPKSSEFFLEPSLRGEVKTDLLAKAVDDLLEDFRSSVEGESASSRTAYLEGRALQLSGDERAAAAKFREVAREDPEPPRPWVRLAECLTELGEYGEAEDVLRRALRAVAPAAAHHLWNVWLMTCFGHLKLAPGEVLRRSPWSAGETAVEDGRGRDRSQEWVSWLLETLAGNRPLRINCGGDEYWSPGGAFWTKDRFYEGGRRHSWHPQPYTYPFPDKIAGTDDDPVYQTERQFPGYGSVPASYRVPLPAGEYRVTLHFVELFRKKPWHRRFDVRLEGKPVLEGFRILEREEDVATALRRSFNLSVADGCLDVEFHHQNGDPKVCGLEIERVN